MKIGILTQYYNTRNYGGALQSYALTYLCEKIGYDAEQLTFEFRNIKDNFNGENINKSDAKNKIKEIIKLVLAKFNIKIKNNAKELIENKYLQNRNHYFNNFLYCFVPHSEKVYNIKNIENVIDDYDAFITGSDQVWNFDGFVEPFYLTFVDGKKKSKIAYAASTARLLSEKEIQYIVKNCADFKAISFREKNVYEQMKDKISCSFTLDPTLLLDEKEWNEITIDFDKMNMNLTKNNYIFTYFLGKNDKNDIVKNEIKKFAISENLKIIDIPFTTYKNIEDLKYAEFEMLDAGPKEFITLIKNAKYVFTDSFHASVFSIIYKKQFCVFDRKDYEMKERFYTLFEIFGIKESDVLKTNFSDIEAVLNINYDKLNYTKFLTYKNDSIEFLKKIQK